MRVGHTVHRWRRGGTIGLVVVGLATSACQKAQDSEGDEFRHALPTREAVEVAVPGGSAQALTVDTPPTAQGLLGATSEYWRLTVGVRDLINGGTLATLLLVKHITSYPPTRVSPDGAVWGPWSEALTPNAWKLTVSRTATGEYAYRLEGKDKHADDASFVTVLSGTHKPLLDAAGAPVEGFGEGALLIDWDAAATLPKHDDNVGKASLSYRRVSLLEPVTVDAAFRQVLDRNEHRLADLDYNYRREPADSGALQFNYSTLTPQPGSWAVKSRWLPTGAGRSDVQLTGFGLPTGATASECWSDRFASVYEVTNWPDPDKNYGNESACAFTGATYYQKP